MLMWDVPRDTDKRRITPSMRPTHSSLDADLGETKQLEFSGNNDVKALMGIRWRDVVWHHQFCKRLGQNLRGCELGLIAGCLHTADNELDEVLPLISVEFRLMHRKNTSIIAVNHLVICKYSTP